MLCVPDRLVSLRICTRSALFIQKADLKLCLVDRSTHSMEHVKLTLDKISNSTID
jgi:hypothetical protein